MVIRVKALRRKRIELRAVLDFLLHEPVRDQPLKVLDEPRVVETHLHLQVRLFHWLTLALQGVEEAGEDVKVGALQPDHRVWRSSFFESSYRFSSLSYPLSASNLK